MLYFLICLVQETGKLSSDIGRAVYLYFLDCQQEVFQNDYFSYIQKIEHIQTIDLPLS